MATILVAQPSQEGIVGTWEGKFTTFNNLRIVLHVEKGTDGQYKATFDSPDQGQNGIPLDSLTYANGHLHFNFKKILSYDADWKDDATGFVGTWMQGGGSLPLNLIASTGTPIVVKGMPQEPSEPVPYIKQDLTIDNKASGVTLSATLTLPTTNTKYPAVILISGSGPQDRDEKIGPHKPFLILADHLTRQGIAVLRYDDRGVGKSTGDFGAATSADFATDAESILQYLKQHPNINPAKIGLIGHSEGGLIAPMIAARNTDVAFIVLMAGPGVDGAEVLTLQSKLVMESMGADASSIEASAKANEQMYALIRTETDVEKLKTVAYNNLTQGMSEAMINENKAAIEGEIAQVSSPWFRYFVTYNPQKALENTHCPVLALNGSKDLQVDAQQNLGAIKNALSRAKNNKVQIEELAGLNHLFRKCKTCTVEEYMEPSDETLDINTMKIIAQWILKN